MRPNSRETTECDACGVAVFFAVTKRSMHSKGGERQCLDAEPNPLGTVAAYRSAAGAWWCRTITTAAEAETDDRHPLEERFKPHAASCRRRPAAAVQEGIPGVDPAPAAGKPVTWASSPSNSSSSASGGVVLPFRRRR